MRKSRTMRKAMAMIELIFAIVVIAISVISIPAMMNIADNASSRIIMDDDMMARISAQMIDKFEARWGEEYVVDRNESAPTYISTITTMADLSCSRLIGGTGLAYRANPDSSAECNLTQFPTDIPSTVGNGANQADGNVSKGIEKLNGGTETLNIVASTGKIISINATYNVRYVPSSADSIVGNTATATWKLGSSNTIATDNGGSLTNKTHLKRVVVRFWSNTLGIDTALTFYKSNIGGS